ncbi:hypothetical protein COCON_G00211400 [Conger conger]|uniref:Uncharacterized protein n=1 Tax=Conger conger TaxID=82655 RepID=A0A9Q1HQG1_CONCO|nr:hypothetical protein COCON_G00211400 [Conger conger]
MAFPAPKKCFSPRNSKRLSNRTSLIALISESTVSNFEELIQLHPRMLPRTGSSSWRWASRMTDTREKFEDKPNQAKGRHSHGIGGRSGALVVQAERRRHGLWE